MNFPKYQTVQVQPHDDNVLLVTLNRPEVLNALNTQMGHDLLDLWLRLTVDAGSVRCVILTGSGGKGFCAGGDLKERDGMTQAAWQAQHELFERSFVALMELPTPVIAALNGHAYGGGLEMALACDFTYATRGARFALSETQLGIMPGGCGTQNLARAVGERRAKKSIHYGLQMDLLTGYRFEIEAYNRLVDTDDRREGVRAFNEKRRPVFVGRRANFPPFSPRPSSPPTGAKRGARHSAQGRRLIDKACHCGAQKRGEAQTCRRAACSVDGCVGPAGRVRVPVRDSRACALARGAAHRRSSKTTTGLSWPWRPGRHRDLARFVNRSER